MSQNIRKLIGMVLIVSFVIVYALIAMLIGGVKFQDASGWAQFIYYALAGLLWTIPVAVIIKWMQRPDPEPEA